jgi:hypothetical protein
MAEMIFVLALATKEINQGKPSKSLFNDTCPWLNIAVKFFKKALLGEDEIESALDRLDQLTGDESKMAIAHIYNAVMEGAHGLLVRLCTWH